ncbi:DUF7507 domain-containing protein, partial [Mycobacterium tuberculosis]|uniref:DUF7507 domain-containing protein n=1 Tax=Mycobacterium tuberculosis TaxID=1773 RepID=UPI0040535273
MTLRSITVIESVFSGAGTPPAPVCPESPAELLPGVTVICEASYTTVAEDITGDPIENTAAATGVSPQDVTVTSPPSSASVATVVPTPTPTPTPLPPQPPLAGTGLDTPT